MAFKTLDRGGMKPAISIDKKTKSVCGYLVGVQTKVGKKRKSVIYELRTKSGELLKCWGASDINRNLLDETMKAIEPEFVGAMVRITFAGERKVKGYKLPFRDFKVEVDTGDKLSRDADYMETLKRGRKKLAKKSGSK